MKSLVFQRRGHHVFTCSRSYVPKGAVVAGAQAADKHLGNVVAGAHAHLLRKRGRGISRPASHPCNNAMSNLILSHNCHTMMLALKELEAEGWLLTPELLAAFSPFRTHHLNRFGLYELKDVMPVPVDYGIKFDIRA